MKRAIVRDERDYFVYIMTNPSRTLYTGLTNSVRRRVREHKLKLTPGFAAKYNITRLVYYESFEDVRKRLNGRNKSRLGRVRSESHWSNR